MSKNILLTSLIAAVGLVGIVAVQGVSAESVRERIGQHSAQREEMRAERQAEHSAYQAQLPNRLDDAVRGGILTEVQKNLLLEKHEAIKAEREDWHEQKYSMSPEERRDAAQQHRDEMLLWAEQNDIPSELVAQGQRQPAEHKLGNGNGMRWHQDR